MTDMFQPDPYEERVCIIVEKVFYSCQQRECFPNFCLDLKEKCDDPVALEDLTFHNGAIDPKSIVITPLASHPCHARAQFTVRIFFTAVVRTKHGKLISVEGQLPDIEKDIVIYYPPSRSEFDFNLRVESKTELLVPAVITGDDLIITVGSFVVFKLTGFVQLQIDAFGYCPAPPPCRDFPSEEPCVDFLDPDETPFPDDFFPPQQSQPCPLT